MYELICYKTDIFAKNHLYTFNDYACLMIKKTPLFNYILIHKIVTLEGKKRETKGEKKKEGGGGEKEEEKKRKKGGEPNILKCKDFLGLRIYQVILMKALT